jgi:DNA-directed RNA polymerase subunit RPC12/RpoP
MFTNQRFIDTRTGEIVTQVPISEIADFQEYDGILVKGDFDITLAEAMTNAGDHASVADAGDTAVTMPSEAAGYGCLDCGTQSIEEAEGQTCRTCGRGIIGRVRA